MRELFLAKLRELGFDASQFGLHSLQAGGATTAANAGVPDRLFKRHGRWRSEAAKDGYVKDSREALLSVTEPEIVICILPLLCDSSIVKANCWRRAQPATPQFE